MGMKCTICRHPQRPTLDSELALGVRLETLARRYAVSVQSLSRHRRGGHIAKAVLDFVAREREMSTVDLDRLRQQVGDTALFGMTKRRAELEALMQRALAADQGHLAVAAAREAKDHDIAIARLCGEMGPRVQHTHVHMAATPEWGKLRQAVLILMRRHPELRGELAEVIKAVEDEPPHLDGSPRGVRALEAPNGAA